MTFQSLGYVIKCAAAFRVCPPSVLGSVRGFVRAVFTEPRIKRGVSEKNLSRKKVKTLGKKMHRKEVGILRVIVLFPIISVLIQARGCSGAPRLINNEKQRRQGSVTACRDRVLAEVTRLRKVLPNLKSDVNYFRKSI